MSMARDYDLAIVGGGIFGAWTLYLAQQRFPHWRIGLVERFRNGDGATAHSAGVLVAMGSTSRERRLAEFSAERYRQIRQSLELRTTAADVFWVTEAAREHDLRQIAVDFTIDVEHLAPHVLRDRLTAPLELGATEVLLRGGSAVAHDPGAIARGLIGASMRSPQVTCVEGVGVRGLDIVASGVALRLDDGSVMRAARVVVAAGPWLAGEPFDALSPTRSLRIKKVVALHVDLIPPPDAAAVFFPQSDAYLMPMPARNQWLFSFRADEWDCRPLKHALEISENDRQIAMRIIERYQPGVSGACRGGRVFCDAYTPNGEPIVERVPDAPVVIAGGGSGAGFRLSPGLADEALRCLDP
jgi:glycine/D-amino acid oxidase-like deaminating enzyme